MITSRIFLRAVVSHLRLTDLLEGPIPTEIGAVFLGRRLCWAAGLAEYEQVEVLNQTKGIRWMGYVRFGREGQVGVSSWEHRLMQSGDVLKISAYAWVPEPAIESHMTTLVKVDPDNLVTEFRQASPRSVTLDPMCFPPRPAQEISVAVEAMD